MANILRKFGISSTPIKTVYPFTTLSSYRVRDKDVPGKYITYINPSYLKGIEIFRKILKKLPRKKFIVVGKGIEKLKIYLIMLLVLVGLMMLEIFTRTLLLYFFLRF